MTEAVFFVLTFAVTSHLVILVECSHIRKASHRFFLYDLKFQSSNASAFYWAIYNMIDTSQMP